MHTEFILYVADQGRSTKFYEEVLQKAPDLNVPGMTEFRLNECCVLGLMPENGIVKILGDKTPHPSSGNGIPRCEIYLHVTDPENYVQRAVAAGGKLIDSLKLRDWGDMAGYISDHDGHIIAFAHRVSEAE